MEILESVDPRLRPSLANEWARRVSEPVDGLPRGVTIVLAGHRAAGKSRLLPFVATQLGREGVDLDTVIEERGGRSIRTWYQADPSSFRRAERDAFASLSSGQVVAVGGGFLSNHADLLRGCLTVLVPLSFETFRERLLNDSSRPRLRPELSLEEELRAVYLDREAKHLTVPTMSLVDLMLCLKKRRARRVVTLPPTGDWLAFAERAKVEGADLLELRTDLIAAPLDVQPLAERIPLLVAERGAPIPSDWRRFAAEVDAADGTLRSFHSNVPMTVQEAVDRWPSLPSGAALKHVEPLGELSQAKRLFQTQRALIERFGPERVTVLATGPLATAFRCVLAEDNALDFLSLDSTWSAVPGQRWLSDAVRSHRRCSTNPKTNRLGILGSPVNHSRSPRIHPQPFDRLELPPDTEMKAFLEAVRPHYRGFAVTNPFKKAAAKAVGASREALNTLARQGTQYTGYDTDWAGAEVALRRLSAHSPDRHVTVLGNGGVVPALREAAHRLGLTLEVRARATIEGPVGGLVVWTWPPQVEAPPLLRFQNALVAVVNYGERGRVIAKRVRELGGTPLRLGTHWFVAQARGQRGHWENAK